MPRIDPLEILKSRRALDSVEVRAPGVGEQATKITIQLPRNTSNELKKLAIDHGISRNRLVYLLVRQLLTDPGLLQTILHQKRRLDGF